MGIFSKVSELFNVKPRTESKEKFYNQLEKIADRASKDDPAYLLESRKFIENIIKETFNLKDKIIDPNILLNDYILDTELRKRLHDLRKRANDMAHSIDYKFNKAEIENDLKAVDDLIDYCCFKNEKINDFELFSLMKRINEEPKIDDDKIFSNKIDTINFEEIQELFTEDLSDKYEYYTSGYNAKNFCMAIYDQYRKESKDCNPIFYVVHNILIRKDMVRKSVYLNKLDLTSAALDSVRLYEILILHSMKYGYFKFDGKNIFSVPNNEIMYIKYAYENIMTYAGILNKMKKNPANLDFEYEFQGNNEDKFYINNKMIDYFFPKYSDNMKVNMWFGDKIDYEITENNKNYFNMMLKDLFGFDSFREGQLDVIKNILENNIENIPLSVFPTGYGKSLIYQFCALMEPQRTIVIVPTEVLACDQIFNLNECGLNIGQIISCYEKNLNDRNGNLIYYTIPDVFLNCDLNDKLSEEDNKDRIYNIVLDECHNISLWGHQFDPTYFSLSKNIISNFKNCNVTMFTATASMLVINDITHQFSDKDIEIFQPVGLKRGHINYKIKKVNNLSDIIKDISNIYKSNYKKNNEWDLNEENICPNKTLIINNDPKILNQIYNELQNNEYLLPEISLYDNTVNNYKSFRTGRKKVMVTNDDFVVGINIPNLVNLICIGVPPSKEWLYQESGRVGRDFEKSNVVIYLPKKPSDLFDKMIDTSFDIKEILANKELQGELNIDVSNINYFNSYFQNKENQLKSFDYVDEQIQDNIYVIGKSPIGELNVNFPKSEKELYNYLLYMMVLFDYIKIWQTRVSINNNIIKYRLYARSKVDIKEMIDYLNDVIKISTKNIEVRKKYIKENNKAVSLRELLNNLLDWYYETIITIKREMMVNTYELLLNDKITSNEIEQNLAIYFDISSNMRSNEDNFEFDDYDEDKIVDNLENEGLINLSSDNQNEIEIIENEAIDISEYEVGIINDNNESSNMAVPLNAITPIVIKKKIKNVNMNEEKTQKNSDNLNTEDEMLNKDSENQELIQEQIDLFTDITDLDNINNSSNTKENEDMIAVVNSRLSKKEIQKFEERKLELIESGKENGYITFEQLSKKMEGLKVNDDSMDQLYKTFKDEGISVVSDEIAAKIQSSNDALLYESNNIIFQNEVLEIEHVSNEKSDEFNKNNNIDSESANDESYNGIAELKVEDEILEVKTDEIVYHNEETIENESLNFDSEITIKSSTTEPNKNDIKVMDLNDEAQINKNENVIQKKDERNITTKKNVKQRAKKKSKIEILKNMLSEIYNDNNINWEFYDIYNDLSKEEKYNLQFIIQKEIESGYIYGYEMMISILELETKGSKLIRFKKFVQNTNKQLLELLVEKENKNIPHANKKLAYKIIYSTHKPSSIFDKLKEWF